MRCMCWGGEFRGVAIATDELQNVVRRSRAAYIIATSGGMQRDLPDSRYF